MHKKIYIFGSAAFLIMSIILFLLDPSIRAFHANDFSAPFWYYITVTGDPIPEFIIIIIMFGAVFLINRNSRRRFISSGLIVLIIAVSALATAGISNFILKDLFHTSRPSHKVFLEDGFFPSGLDSFYLKNNVLRREYIKEHVDPKDAKLSGYYAPDVNVWIREVGESFPSAHALNSFLIGTIFCYLLLFYLKSRLQYLAFIPLLWAILVSLSRYIVGVHEKIDIYGGAAIGLGLAFIIIRLKIFERIDTKFQIKKA